MDTVADTGSLEPVDQGKVPTPGGEVAIKIRLMAIAAAARFHGAELHQSDLRSAADEIPSPAALTDWLRASGLWAKAVRLPWKQLVSLELTSPLALLLTDGSAVLLVANDKKRSQVWIRHSQLAPAAPPVAVSKSDFEKVWAGEAVLIRAKRTTVTEDSPFSLGWVAQLVWMERHAMRDVGLASLVLTILTVRPR